MDLREGGRRHPFFAPAWEAWRARATGGSSLHAIRPLPMRKKIQAENRPRHEEDGESGEVKKFGEVEKVEKVCRGHAQKKVEKMKNVEEV